MTRKTKGNLIRQDEARALVCQVKDSKTRNLVNAFFAVLWAETQGTACPVSDFDLEFLANILLKFCNKHDLILAIVKDEENLSWPD